MHIFFFQMFFCAQVNTLVINECSFKFTNVVSHFLYDNEFVVFYQMQDIRTQHKIGIIISHRSHCSVN